MLITRSRLDAPQRLQASAPPPPAPAAAAAAAPESDFERPRAALLDLQGVPPAAWAPLAERPETAVDPGRVGVVLNDHPLNLPTAQELRDLGVTAARISLSGANFNAGDPENQQAWQDRLADYRGNGIDVTLNLPRELDGSGTFPEPPAREQTGTDDQGQPIWRVLPSDQQPQSWKDDFNAWKQDAYLPAVQRVLDATGGYAGAYEVWNEPDEQANRVDYSPALPAGQFGELLRDVYGMVRGPDADPDAPPGDGPRVIAGGLDSGSPDWLDGASVDGKLYADAVGVHPYTKRPDDSYDADEPWNWTGTVADIASAYSRFNRPLDFTEAGDRRGFSDYIPAFATAAGREGNVERSYFFWGDPYDGEFGLTAGRDEEGHPIYRAGASGLQERIRQWNEAGAEENSG